MIEPDLNHYNPTYPPAVTFAAVFAAALIAGVFIFEGAVALLA